MTILRSWKLNPAWLAALLLLPPFAAGCGSGDAHDVSEQHPGTGFAAGELNDNKDTSVRTPDDAPAAEKPAGATGADGP